MIITDESQKADVSIKHDDHNNYKNKELIFKNIKNIVARTKVLLKFLFSFQNEKIKNIEKTIKIIFNIPYSPSIYC